LPTLGQTGADRQTYSEPLQKQAIEHAPYSMENFKHLMHSSLVQGLSVEKDRGFGYLSAASTRAPSRMNGDEEKENARNELGGAKSPSERLGYRLHTNSTPESLTPPSTDK